MIDTSKRFKADADKDSDREADADFDDDADNENDDGTYLLHLLQEDRLVVERDRVV
jgi:hypothetical protein